jgi:hypothetical protein
MIAVTVDARRNIHTLLSAHPSMKLISLGSIFMAGGASLAANAEASHFLVGEHGFIVMTIEALETIVDRMR